MGVFRDLSTPTTVQALLDTTPKFDSEGNTTNDMGNVHHNSTVLSHAFYLAANELGKFDESNQQLLNIWISAVRSLQKDEKKFVGFIRTTINISFQQSGSPFEKAIKNAWIKIGYF
ncbi:MAG TPA: M4 family metallopeptidase [Rhabdochlamydiaceae bacterium]|nr:M4 family metallopeptidase [Rhabdochlamydiaceae bacterium]